MSTHLSLQHAQRCIAAAIAEARRQRLAVCAQDQSIAEAAVAMATIQR